MPVLESAISHLILPAIVVAAYPAGLIARMVRASVLDTLGEEPHPDGPLARLRRPRDLRPAGRCGRRMNPVVQVTALVFAYSLANTFLVEAVFDWPGLGSYAANSLQALDTPAIIGVTLIVAIVYVVAEPARGHRAGRHRPADPAAMTAIAAAPVVAQARPLASPQSAPLVRRRASCSR